MRIEEAIKKAVEGGWNKKSGIVLKDGTLHSCLDTMFLDPLFWQSLGKALGWIGRFVDARGGIQVVINPEEDLITTDEKKLATTSTPAWLYNWHRFIDHLSEGKDPESFFHSL